MFYCNDSWKLKKIPGFMVEAAPPISVTAIPVNEGVGIVPSARNNASTNGEAAHLNKAPTKGFAAVKVPITV